jgi:hypothetical protein
VEKFKQFFKEQTNKEWDEKANGKMPPPKKDVDRNSLPAHEGWFYLEEKTTILGAFLRESQSTGCGESTSRIASDGIRENDVKNGAKDSKEGKMANHQVKDGGENGSEADEEDEEEEMDK